MVSLSRLHAPNSVIVDILLLANQTNTRRTRDFSVHLRRNAGWVDSEVGTGDYDQGNAGE